MSPEQLPDIPGVDVENLYRQDAFTDLKVGSIQRLTPVKTDGTEDESRSPKFVASTSIMTPQGMLPIQADIEADTLAQAIEKFPEAIKDGVQKMVDQAREMEREARNGIVVPKGDMGLGGQPGAKPGGGNIIM